MRSLPSPPPFWLEISSFTLIEVDFLCSSWGDFFLNAMFFDCLLDPFFPFRFLRSPPPFKPSSTIRFSPWSSPLYLRGGGWSRLSGAASRRPLPTGFGLRPPHLFELMVTSPRFFLPWALLFSWRFEADISLFAWLRGRRFEALGFVAARSFRLLRKEEALISRPPSSCLLQVPCACAWASGRKVVALSSQGDLALLFILMFLIP